MSGRAPPKLIVIAAVTVASLLLLMGLLLWAPQEPSLRWGERVWEFSDRRVFLVVVALPWLLVGSLYSLTGLPWQQRALSLLLRSAMLLALLLGLARPTEASWESKVCGVALVDVSQSVSDDSLAHFTRSLGEIYRAKGKKDELRLLAFAENVREVPLRTGPDGQLLVPRLEELRGEGPGDATNVEAALQLAPAWTRSDCLARYYLWSDGIETRGDALTALSEARAPGVRLFTSALSKAPPRDVAVTGVEVPQGVRVGEPFSVRVRLTSTTESAGQLRLYQGATLNGLEGARAVTVPAGESAQVIQSVVRVPGDITYRAEFLPEGPDRFAQNNGFQTSLEVPGPPRVLLVDRRPDQATYLAQALVAQQLDVDVRKPSALPRSRAEYNAFDFVILSDVAYGDVTRGAEAQLMDYVRGGGGLLFAGGEAGYGPGGWDRSALKRILPVTMEAKKEREMPGVAMALVIDRSGSMTGLPLAMAKEACNATVGVLEGNDLLEVIAFDSRPTRYVKMQPARYASRIASSVARIQPGGGTELFNSLDMAYQDLSVVEARKKHIVLLTDGNAASDGLYELASTAFSEGITITTVGLGTGVNHSLLQMIAETGGGRFHVAEEPSRLPRIFTRETEIISKKATLEDWFPVQAVATAKFLEGVGIASAPLLRGYTSTQLGAAPSTAILVSDRGEPILARRPVGLGWTLAWTSDLKTRWALDWLKWGGFGRLMAQLVREHQVRDDTQIRPMTLELDGDELVAKVEAFDEQENFDNSLSSTLFVRLISATERTSTAAPHGNNPTGGPHGPSAPAPQGSSPAASQSASPAESQGTSPTTPLDNGAGGPAADSTPFVRVAPGLYEARAVLPHFGAYAVRANHQLIRKEGPRPGGVSYGSVSRPYPEEYHDLTPRLAELTEWAEATRGSHEPPPERMWAADGDKVRTHQDRQSDFIWLALVLFFLDLFLRRVRIFDRRFQARDAV